MWSTCENADWSGENENCTQSGKAGCGGAHFQPQHSETEADKSEFKASLIDIASAGTARATQ